MTTPNDFSTLEDGKVDPATSVLARRRLMEQQARFQRGSLRLEKRRSQPDVWTFRHYVEGPDGTRTYPKQMIGTVLEIPNRKDAEKAVLRLRVTINAGTPFTPMSVYELVAHYREHEFPRLAFSTTDGYKCYLDRYILPKFGSRQIASLMATEVEKWLDTLILIKKTPWRKGQPPSPAPASFEDVRFKQKSKKNFFRKNQETKNQRKQPEEGQPAAPGTRSKIRNLMSAIFSHAIRHKWMATNPITEVRTSAKRQRIPDVLTPGEFQAVMTELAVREQAAVWLDGSTGLRRSELIAGKWKYYDFIKQEAQVQHSMYRNRPGTCKTETSRKPVALHPMAITALEAWRAISPYPGDDDFIFPSLRLKGAKPFSPDAMLNDYIRPALVRAGITGKVIGWHSFRHGVAQTCHLNRVPLKVAQEIMRHANSRLTQDIYQQAISPEKREAQNRVVEALLGQKKMG
jgi:integrase